MFKHKHLISIADLTANDITYILDRADQWAAYCTLPFRQNNALAGLTQINAFFEPSTRTHLSFDLAGKQLGAYVGQSGGVYSSSAKGETFKDTILTLNAMLPHVMVIRHSDDDAARQAAELADCSIINAGTGVSDHPTQALLDAQTIRQYYGNFKNLKVAICGDIRHSRVAASNIQCLTKLGAIVRLIGPKLLMPDEMPKDLNYFESFEEGIKDVDIIMMLRTQWERIPDSLRSRINSLDLSERYQLTRKRFELTAPGASIMHPGPINRGSEIDPELAYGPESLILRQVQLGVATRMACLDVLTENLRNIDSED